MKSEKAERLLRSIRRYRWISFTAQLALLASATSLAVRLLTVIPYKFSYEPAAAFPIAILGASAVLLFRAIARFTSLTSAGLAERVDVQEQLQDRLATYLQLRESNHPFLPALVQEMESRLDTVSARRAARMGDGFAGSLCFAAFTITAAAVLILLPDSTAAVLQRQERAAIRKQAENLEKKIIAIQKRPALKNPELEKLLKSFKQTAAELQKPETGKADALKKLNTMRAQLNAEETRQNQISAKESQHTNESEKTADGGPGGTLDPLSQEGTRPPRESRPSIERSQEANTKEKSDPAMTDKQQKAIADYKAEKAQSAKEMADLKKALDDAHKGISSGGAKWTADSELSERQIEKQKGGVQDGPGTTNKDIGPQKFDTTKNGKSEYVEDRTKSKYEELYKGQRENVKTEPLFLGNQWNEKSEQRYVNIRTFGANRNSNAALNAASGSQQDSGESAIRRERIPASYQKIVKQYFASIKEQ